MNAIQRISHELRTERLARALGLEDGYRLEPGEVRERWWRLRKLEFRGGDPGRARQTPEEASSFLFHSME